MTKFVLTIGRNGNRFKIRRYTEQELVLGVRKNMVGACDSKIGRIGPIDGEETGDYERLS